MESCLPAARPCRRSFAFRRAAIGRQPSRSASITVAIHRGRGRHGGTADALNRRENRLFHRRLRQRRWARHPEGNGPRGLLDQGRLAGAVYAAAPPVAVRAGTLAAARTRGAAAARSTGFTARHRAVANSCVTGPRCANSDANRSSRAIAASFGSTANGVEPCAGLRHGIPGERQQSLPF